jgi:hypothetical protein
MANADDVFRIEENVEITSMNISQDDRIDVMDDNDTANCSVLDSQVATHIADDNVSTETLPFGRGVEDLV